MGTRDPASGTAPAAVAVRRRPRPVTVTLLALYAAAAVVGVLAGGTAERLLGPVLLAVVVLRLVPHRRGARRPGRGAPAAAVRPRAAGSGDAADA
ncbi:hypothetical protein ACFSJS_17230 [Streptomyces desertarenae]|uniref:Sensor histidine kinase n=1 Tax=Streptomyces desertarenae TaxID=2666184 RepID=A0ABW4PKY8_9ACTN